MDDETASHSYITLQVLIFHDGSNVDDMQAFAAGVASFVVLLVHLVATTIVSASLNEAVSCVNISPARAGKTIHHVMLMR